MYSEEYGENEYMEQEEEWEREGLLDPAWEKQQKKVSESCEWLHKEMNFDKWDHACKCFDSRNGISCANNMRDEKMMRWRRTTTIVKCDGKFLPDVISLHRKLWNFFYNKTTRCPIERY